MADPRKEASWAFQIGGSGSRSFKLQGYHEHPSASAYVRTFNGKFVSNVTFNKYVACNQGHPHLLPPNLRTSDHQRNRTFEFNGTFDFIFRSSRRKGDLRKYAVKTPCDPLAYAPVYEIFARCICLCALLLFIVFGMYFSQVILKNVSTTRWEQPLGNKKFADYGHIVVMGGGSVPLNPIRIAVTLAYAFAAKEQPGSRLLSLYETWAKMLK